jgi:hypothetical protein
MNTPSIRNRVVGFYKEGNIKKKVLYRKYIESSLQEYPTSHFINCCALKRLGHRLPVDHSYTPGTQSKSNKSYKVNSSHEIKLLEIGGVDTQSYTSSNLKATITHHTRKTCKILQ